MPLLSHLDLPQAGTLCDPLNFFVIGWAYAGDDTDRFDSIEVIAGGEKIGESFSFRERLDVVKALALPAGSRTGFEILCRTESRGAAELAITVQTRRGDRVAPIAHTTVRLSPFDHRRVPFGQVLDPGFLALLRREQVYASGPSESGTSPECRGLIEKHVGPPPRRLLDVGCGLGGYGRQLLELGYDWTGAEMKPGDLAELARQELPHRAIDGVTLPFADRSADHVMCIEVLEHIADPHAFLAETRRVAPALVLSVPNFELVPYLSRYHATPWHILEADHKNFFTRSSLRHLLEQYYPRVEITAYGRFPLATPEGTPLYYHLFASAGPAG